MKIIRALNSLARLLLVSAALVSHSHAQQMNYQGRLTDSNGGPLQDGQYTLIFDLYDSPSAGNQVWGPFFCDSVAGTGHTTKADLVNGRFNIILGSADTAARPLSGSFGGPRFLQITISGNPPMLPRQQILAAPESLHSINADHATIADGISGTLNITGDFNVGGNSTVLGAGTFGQLTTGNFTTTGTSTLAGLTSTQDITAQKSINFFPNSQGSKVNFYTTSYAIGVQDFTEYFRSSFNFGWYVGGTHASGAYDAGAGGKTLEAIS